MSKHSLRTNILVSSVNRLLKAGETAGDVVMLWTRHRLFLPYIAFSGVVLFIVASVVGVEPLLTRLVLAACGVAIGGMATTNYWVLATTGDGLVLCRASRVRQYAKDLEKRLPESTEIEMVASTVITSDWRVDGTIYTLTKRWEATMRALSTR